MSETEDSRPVRIDQLQVVADRLPERVPSEFLSATFHLDVLDELVYETQTEGSVPLASDPDNRYPYAYPRDIACITRAWLAALRHGVRPERCRDNIVDAAKFMLSVQEDDGRWRQRYALDGTDKSIYVQEDNVAHGLRVLSHAVIAAEETSGLDSVDDFDSESVVEAIRRAVDHASSDLYDPNAHLIESTTSIHEGRIESGYTLWVNCSFLAGLRLATEALSRVSTETEPEADSAKSFLSSLESGVRRSFGAREPVPRRYTPEGDIDTRPDITLLAPYYYELGDIFGDGTGAAAERAAAELTDPEIGGLQRFQGFYRDFDVHQHGGNGPWMQYTAWLAQYCFDVDDDERARSVLATIGSYADENGYIPEHLTTRARFESFMENEWHTRRDFEKEFDEAVLRDVPFDYVVEELSHMRDSYQSMQRRMERRDVVAFARPLAWSHAEFLTALIRGDE